MRKLTPLAGCLLVLTAVGCGHRLNEERTAQVGPADEHSLIIEPASRDQKVHVQMQATGGPVNVYCFLEKDKADAEKAARSRKPSDKILASEQKKEEADLDFPVPANTRAVVLLTGASAKTASVKVKLTNR